MTDTTRPPRPASFDDPDALARLKKRHAAERRFRLYGQMAICFALLFLGLLVASIGSQALSATAEMEKFFFDLGSVVIIFSQFFSAFCLKIPLLFDSSNCLKMGCSVSGTSQESRISPSGPPG